MTIKLSEMSMYVLLFTSHHKISHNDFPYSYSSCCCSSACWGDIFKKKANASVISNQTWVKFGSIVLQVNMHHRQS